MKRCYTGVIYGTNERGKFELIGYWVGARGKRIGSYLRVDKSDNKQYSRDKNNTFYVETED